MKGFFDELISHFRRDSADLPDEVVQGIFRLLESARLQQIPCSEVFAKLDEYVESELRDHRAARLMPLLREHLDTCDECCEEYEALLSLMEKSAPTDSPDVA